MNPADFNRRKSLKTLALAPTLSVALPSWAKAQAGAAGLVSTDVCMLTPEVMEGPFFLDEKLVRADITEGRPGLPLRLRLQVVNADCSPVAGALVHVWQCDAEGLYSGVDDQGTGRI